MPQVEKISIRKWALSHPFGNTRYLLGRLVVDCCQDECAITTALFPTRAAARKEQEMYGHQPTRVEHVRVTIEVIEE